MHTTIFSLFPPPSVISHRGDDTWAQILLQMQNLTSLRACLQQRSLLLQESCFLSHSYHGSAMPSPTLPSTHISNRPHFSQSRCTVSQPVLVERVPLPPSICSPGLHRQQTVQPCNDDLGFVPPQDKKIPPLQLVLVSIISFYQKT